MRAHRVSNPKESHSTKKAPSAHLLSTHWLHSAFHAPRKKRAHTHTYIYIYITMSTEHHRSFAPKHGGLWVLPQKFCPNTRGGCAQTPQQRGAEHLAAPRESAQRPGRALRAPSSLWRAAPNRAVGGDTCFVLRAFWAFWWMFGAFCKDWLMFGAAFCKEDLDVKQPLEEMSMEKIAMHLGPDIAPTICPIHSDSFEVGSSQEHEINP